MDKGGTKQPTKRKTSGFNIGDEAKCIAAHSPWYTVGETYQVVEHPETFVPAVQGSDGLYDEMCLVLSKFEKVEKNESKSI